MAGGLPTVTYNPRAQLNLESKVLDYIDERHRVLSVSGPTKTGKTVLVKNVLQGTDAIWVSGGSIRSLDDLWATIADELLLDTSIESSRRDTETKGQDTSGELNLRGVAKVSKAVHQSTSTSVTDRATRVRPTVIAARKALRATLTPLVIDDFHYISSEVQIEIVRSLKDLVFDGVPVIVVAVPHRAYDVVRVEKEMTGRVQQLSIGAWSNNELSRIAEKGFQALNVIDEGGIITTRLAAESFASPHLMQDFCLQVVKDSGFGRGQSHAALLQQPQWEWFFEERSNTASKTAFDMLVRGPRQRTDRKPRALRGGLIVDIYGAVLMAIGHTGPLTSLTYEQLRAAVRDIVDDPPSGQEIARILGEMSRIARELEGEPVVDYDSELSTLHISDPYFAYFLRWRARAELTTRAESIQGVVPSGDAAGYTSESPGDVRPAQSDTSALSDARQGTRSGRSRVPRKIKRRLSRRRKG